MKTEFFAVLAAVLAASVSAADLPVSRAALAREGQLVREGAKMVVTPLVRDGKPHERVEFSAGERTLVVSGNVGTFPHNYTTHFGRLDIGEALVGRYLITGHCHDQGSQCQNT